MDYNLVTNTHVVDIDHWDYPDFCDAYIESAEYDGRDATDEELEEMNEDRDFVYQCIEKQLY